MSDLGSYSISGNSSRTSGAAALRQAAPAANAQRPEALNTVSGSSPGGMTGGGSSGGTLRGQIVSAGGKNVTLMLEDGSQVNARLENGMTLTPGQELSFLIRGRAGESLMLSPLMENTSSDPTMLKALQQAGLPVNAKTLALVGALMDAGENIAKPNLLRMSHLMNAHPSAEPAALVGLKSLGLPVTEDNLKELTVYRNLEHELLSSAGEISDGIAEDLSALLRSGDTDQAAVLAKGLEQLLKGTGEAGGEVQEALPDFRPAEGNGAAAELPTAGKDAPGSLTEAQQGVHTDPGEKVIFSEQSLTELASGKDASAAEAAISLQENGEAVFADGKTEKAASDATAQAAADDGKTEKNASGEAVFAEAEKASKPLGDTPQAESTAPPENAAAKTPLTAAQLMELAAKNPKELRERLKSALMDRFSVSPEEVDKENVEKLYARLRSDTDRLSNLLSQAGKEGGRGFEEIKNLRQNLNFMQDMNQIFGYIQLPLKLEGREATGDLYVFGRKGKKPQPGEPVSALLHLDMDNLGPLDVYVSMKDKEVNARFTLRDEETVSFIAEHIDALKSRIVKRGYQISTSLGAAKEDEPGLMEQMLSPGAGHPVISHQAFEARV